MSAPLLAAASVGRCFGQRWALRDVSLVVAAGETVALVGANGAGKTTLLGLLAGTLDPSEGAVDGGGERAGVVPQRVALWRRLSARENLMLLARLSADPAPAAAVASLLEACGLGEVADRRVSDLSVGQAQRVNVAAGLLGAPSVVLLDEPTASLDPRQRRLLWRLLAGVAGRGGAVVFTTQNVEEVAAHADRLVALDEGRVAYAGSVADFRVVTGAGEREPFEDAFVRFLDGLVDGPDREA